MASKELSPEQNALLAGASTLVQAVVGITNPAIASAVTAATALLNSVLNKPQDYTMDDFNAAVALDDAASIRQGQASEEVRNAATPKG